MYAMAEQFVSRYHRDPRSFIAIGAACIFSLHQCHGMRGMCMVSMYFSAVHPSVALNLVKIPAYVHRIRER